MKIPTCVKWECYDWYYNIIIDINSLNKQNILYLRMKNYWRANSFWTNIWSFYTEHVLWYSLLFNMTLSYQDLFPDDVTYLFKFSKEYLPGYPQQIHLEIPRLSHSSDFLLSKLFSFHSMFRVSYISWLVRFPLIRRVHLYLLLSYHCHNISPLFSQSFILVPFLFLVHWRSLHYHPRFLERTHNSLSFCPHALFLSRSLFYSPLRFTCSINGLYTPAFHAHISVFLNFSELQATSLLFKPVCCP